MITEGDLTVSEIRELVNIAHGEGFAVMSHTNGAQNVKSAVEGGVDSVEHGSYMDDDAISYLAQSGTLWVPTIATQINLLRTERYPHDVVKKISDEDFGNIVKAIKLGTNVGVGSDAGAYAVPHGSGTMDEYGYIREAAGDEETFSKLLDRSIKYVREKFTGPNSTVS